MGITQPRCKTCPGTVVSTGEPGIHVCADCGTEYAEKDAVLSILGHAGVSPEVLVGLGAGSGVSRVMCAACGRACTTVTLKATQVEWCRSCGGMWLDSGERQRLSRGAQGGPARAPAALVPATPRGPAMVPSTSAGSFAAHGTGALQQFMAEWERVRIKQRMHTMEALLPVERANTYTIDTGSQVGVAQEEGGSMVSVLARQMLRSSRPLAVGVADGNMRPILKLRRPFAFFTPRMSVMDADGRLLGAVQKHFTLLVRSYDLEDARGKVFATIRGTLLKPWTFVLRSPTGGGEGVLLKRWSGAFKEMVTDADNFELDLGTLASLGTAERAVVLAAAVCVDMDYFEKGSRGGLLRLFPE